MKPKQEFKRSPRLPDCSRPLDPNQASAQQAHLQFASPELRPPRKADVRGLRLHAVTTAAGPQKSSWPFTGLGLVPWLGPWESQVKDSAVCPRHTSQ